MRKYPEGTTKEQWDRYEANLQRHEERVKRLQPDPKKYGFESSRLTPGTAYVEHSGGWTTEGGEKEFRKAVAEWEMMRSCDAPNEPGYHRANND